MVTLSCSSKNFEAIYLEKHDCNKMFPGSNCMAVQVSLSFYELLYWEIINFEPLITWPIILNLIYPPPPQVCCVNNGDSGWRREVEFLTWNSTAVRRTFLFSSDLYFLGFNPRSNLYHKKQNFFASSMVQLLQLSWYFPFYYSVSYVSK